VATDYLYAGDDWPPWAVCGNPARKGFLTCVKHQDREAAARKLQTERVDLDIEVTRPECASVAHSSAESLVVTDPSRGGCTLAG